MEIPFVYQGYKGRVTAFVERMVDPPSLGAWEGAKDLASCTATIEYVGV
jgi:hypothetical protein